MFEPCRRLLLGGGAEGVWGQSRVASPQCADTTPIWATGIGPQNVVSAAGVATRRKIQAQCLAAPMVLAPRMIRPSPCLSKVSRLAAGQHNWLIHSTLSYSCIWTLSIWFGPLCSTLRAIQGVCNAMVSRFSAVFGGLAMGLAKRYRSQVGQGCP